MNSPTIMMERQVALTKLEEYEAAAQYNPERTNETDRQIMLGYKLLARGKRLIDVNAAIAAGGCNVAGLPRLAIARAHVEFTVWEASSAHQYDAATNRRITEPNGGGNFFFSEHSRWGLRYKSDRFRWTLPADTIVSGLRISRAVKAMTPLIPLPHRPRHDLSNYFLLWEASWTPAQPPTDPYLLRPVASALMEILAEWDVTPLEVAAVRNAMAAKAATR